MKIAAHMTLEEVAAFVCSHLAGRGITTVLTGGACAAIYSGGEIVSHDLDFIETVTAGRRRLREALAEIGFTEEDRYFKHPETDFFLEFPAGPLAVGREPTGDPMEMTVGACTLRLLSPTDCVKDRLAAFYHWNDRQSLGQAVAVAKKNRVRQTEVARWSLAEGQQEKYRLFLRELRKARAR